ncbi:hypothetical protein FQZ97_638680 [compost metagenome]
MKGRASSRATSKNALPASSRTVRRAAKYWTSARLAASSVRRLPSGSACAWMRPMAVARVAL